MGIGSHAFARSASRLVVVVCAAQVLVQIGAFFWLALMPGIMPLWKLTNSEAGWITASFYGRPARSPHLCCRRLLSPPDLVSSAFASDAGNEAAIRYGRKRLVVTAMITSIVIGATIGFVGSMSYAVAAVLLTLYGIVIWLDSSSLTAGTAGTSERPGAGRRSPFIRCLATRVGLWGRCWSDGSSTCSAACHN